ncbi:hypothetical protein Trydic_g18301 [Trypoxylus dichotomus]
MIHLSRGNGRIRFLCTGSDSLSFKSVPFLEIDPPSPRYRQVELNVAVMTENSEGAVGCGGLDLGVESKTLKEGMAREKV